MRPMQVDDLKRLITKGLAKNERLILLLYYYEGMTMKEIGATLKLSESRVSQMHTAIIERLKGQLGSRADDFAVA
jgi:RNA polymerase sigma factor for flagellar operon FliA